MTPTDKQELTRKIESAKKLISIVDEMNVHAARGREYEFLECMGIMNRLTNALEFMLNQLPDQASAGDGWISVDDRLPERVCENVIVFCEGGKIDKTMYQEGRFKYLKETRYSRKNQGKLSGYFELAHEYGYKITHWQPLPNPPSDKTGDQE